MALFSARGDQMDLTYDFSDWGLHDDERGIVERIVHRHLREAFSGFAEEGRWGIDLDDPRALVWDPGSVGDGPVWKGETFPIALKITPTNLGDALMRDLVDSGDYHPADVERILSVAEKAVARQFARVRRAIMKKPA